MRNTEKTHWYSVVALFGLLVPAVVAHHALDDVTHDMVRWSLNHHRTLLEVVQGETRFTPEEAIVTHLRMCYSNPERYSSFGLQVGRAIDA